MTRNRPLGHPLTNLGADAAQQPAAEEADRIHLVWALTVGNPATLSKVELVSGPRAEHPV